MKKIEDTDTSHITDEDILEGIEGLIKKGIVERVGPDRYQLTALGRQVAEAMAEADPTLTLPIDPSKLN